MINLNFFFFKMIVDILVCNIILELNIESDMKMIQTFFPAVHRGAVYSARPFTRLSV